MGYLLFNTLIVVKYSDLTIIIKIYNINFRINYYSSNQEASYVKAFHIHY